MANFPSQPPVLIIGAGISGLLLAQHLRTAGVRFRLFERDADLDTRGLGWGLTLHWSLPALRSLLPADIFARIPEAYVDRKAVAEGRPSTFPFYDLSTGELKAKTPAATEAQRIRVTRDRLRRVLAEGLDIEWGKALSHFDLSTSEEGPVTICFDDGSSATGSLVVACDGGNSRVRRALFPDKPRYQIPVRLMGVKLDCSTEQIEPLRKLDPYFLQGAASVNDSYVYFSVLDAPENVSTLTNEFKNGLKGRYTCQVVISWPIRPGFFGRDEPLAIPPTDRERIQVFRDLASTWADPFRSFVLGSLPEDGGDEVPKIKHLELYDWPPPKDLRTVGHVSLVGDAVHPMAMYRGEGANHAIVDVLDFSELVTPLLMGHRSAADLRTALDAYEDRVVARTRPAVLASRQACLDAHEWSRITDKSPLLTRRAMYIDFDETSTNGVV